MYVLGINSIYHESAACLLHDGRLVAAAEEERFNRVKHAKTPKIDNPHELPLRAIDFCLGEAGCTLEQIDHVGFAADPEARRRAAFPPDDERALEYIANVEQVPPLLELMGFRGGFSWVDHHAAHAASAFYPSGFEHAAVLTVDGIGDANTTATYHGTGTSLRLVQDVPLPHSLGFLWELTSMFLGFHIYDACKVMGLAAYGNPERFRAQFDRLVAQQPDGTFEVCADLVHFDELDYLTPTGYFGGLESLFGIGKRQPHEALERVHQDVAAALQAMTDDVVLHVARHAHERTESKNLCLAGGVALNCVTNQRLLDEGPFEQLFVQPAAHDAGLALGAAWHVWHNERGHERGAPMRNAYLGPEFTTAEIESALLDAELEYERAEDVEAEVARLLSEGNVVGFFQGRMEIGPRALGNRSLLADPRDRNVREVLNQKVKHREYFRPFAPSVLDSEAEEWFRMGKDSSAYEFMLMAPEARPEVRERIPAVLHEDGTSRIQIVRREANPRYHRLISEFQRLTGVPIVLNTSFNDSEPIVCSPRDAIHTFLKTDIDYLAMGDFLVAKAKNRREQPPEVRIVAPPLQRVAPAVPRLLDEAVRGKRLQVLDGIHVLTDRLDYTAIDQVLPLFAEQRFFLDELRLARVEGRRALEIGLGSGVLSIAVARGGAEHVTALEINPRARHYGAFNVVLNGLAERIEVRDGNDDVFAPVAGERFDFVFSNPPFMPTPKDAKRVLHSAAGPYGLDFTEKLFARLDEHLTEDGCAQFVTVAPGDEQGPGRLRDLADEHLRGAAEIHVNPHPARFADVVLWLAGRGETSEAAARELLDQARRDGVSHVHLCVMHYERSGAKSSAVRRSTKSYPEWDLPLAGLEPR